MIILERSPDRSVLVAEAPGGVLLTVSRASGSGWVPAAAAPATWNRNLDTIRSAQRYWQDQGWDRLLRPVRTYPLPNASSRT